MHTPPIELPESLVWCDPERLGGKPGYLAALSELQTALYEKAA